jgi:primosomal protein N'
MVRDLRDNHQRRIEVTSFFEELPMPVVGKVVSKASATFSAHPLMSIHANHSDMVKFASIEDNAFKRLAPQRSLERDAVREQSICRPRNRLTTIEQALQRMSRDLNNAGPQRFVITGMGGQGKSEVCLQLARRVRQL